MVVFTEVAVQELEDASEYYELQQLSLSKQFKKEIQTTISLIEQYPEAWSI